MRTMPYDPRRHHRRSIRLKGYDYTQAGAYFITICTQDRRRLFGEVVNGRMRLNDAGEIVRDEWFRTAALRPYVRLDDDEFVAMPNHIHGIVRIVGDVEVRHHAEERRRRAVGEQFGKPVPGSVSTIIRAFKSATTRGINALRDTPGGVVWQRNYYEHVIRDEDALHRIQRYIIANPARWTFDRQNPSAPAANTHPHPPHRPHRG
jgi:putative transposase